MNLYIVVPCYNEELVLNETTKQLSKIINLLVEQQKISVGSILYVDDGSKDSTWRLIESLSQKNELVHGLKLAHNVGHQNALWAGLEYVSDNCDAAVSIDADLQHDVNAIVEMVDRYNDGYEVVYGVRNSRATDSWFKKHTALKFYKFMKNMGVDIIPNHADFRLLSKNALKALVSFPERNLFLRGMVRLIGFKETEVYFDVHERFAGESKYTTKRMMNFALDGITSFSVAPLHFITMFGVFSVFLSICGMLYALISFFVGRVVAGWTSLLVSVWLIGGIIISSIGIVGEYIGKIYFEVKRRPRYIIEKTI